MKSENYSKAINEIVQHLVNVGMENGITNTYESGLDKGARLMLAYLMKHGFINDDNIDLLCETFTKQ